MDSQKECVYKSVIGFFTSSKTSFTAGQNAKDLIDTEGRKVIHESIFKAFKSGNVALKTEMNDEELRKYIPGLLSNHLRKDLRLNGGEKYEAVEPGKFSGNSDPKIKEMRKLLKTVKGRPEEAAVQAALDGMIAEWRAANNKASIEIDMNLIPEQFRKLVG